MGFIFSLILFIQALASGNQMSDIRFIGTIIASAIFYCGWRLHITKNNTIIKKGDSCDED